MFRAPEGVAICVSGLAQTHCRQPRGQVPSAGAKHWGKVATGPSTSQQSCPTAHQLCPQHTVLGGPSSAVQGKLMHWPFWHTGDVPGQTVPHWPQLLGSFVKLRQALLQQSKPAEVQLVSQGVTPVPPPILEAPPMLVWPPSADPPPTWEAPPAAASPVTDGGWPLHAAHNSRIGMPVSTLCVIMSLNLALPFI